MRRLSRHRRALWTPLALGGLAAGVVAAQPAPPPADAPAEAPPSAAPGQPGATVEAPPPGDAPAAAPIVTPPVKDEEVAPAPAPKAQVAEKPVVAPIRRARYDTAILQALDKVTAETLRFEAPVGRPVRWKGLVFTVRACERSAPDEPVEDSIAYMTIDSQPRPQPGKAAPPSRQAFKGWMYAASPSLNPVEHATYDAWVISCRQTRPLTPATAVTPPPAVAPEPEPAPKAVPAPKAAPPAKVEPRATPAPEVEPAPEAAPSPSEPAASKL